MRQLSPAGRQAIDTLAQRHGFSPAAVLSMLDSVINGSGSMAQFNHGEFGGSGQWMRGGMIMLSDMFNSHLKGRIDALCNDLAVLVSTEPDLMVSGSFQSQSQGGQRQLHVSGGQAGGYPQNSQYDHDAGSVSLFAPPAPGSSGTWWPADLGWPNSTGAQNNARYAYFAQIHRLAIDVNGHVTVYDTLDHQITGFSQQQSHSGSHSFSSQHGLIDMASLPVVSGDAPSAPPSPPVFASTPMEHPAERAPFSPAAELDVFATIEKLAVLKAKGILTDEEFSTKKTELLARL
jgi:hypothetical protein